MRTSNDSSISGDHLPAGPTVLRRRRARSLWGPVGLALVLVACGSDGPSALSADDLAGEADGVCRAATRAIGRLDTDDPEAFLEDSIEELEAASDDLDLLVPDEDAKDDYDDFTSVVSKQVRQAKKVLAAVESGDSGALSAALDDFTELSTESDDLADGLDAPRCVGLGQAVMAGVGGGSTTSSMPDTTVATTDSTAPDTLPPTTVATTVAPTLPPITTAPPTTAAPVTAPPATEPPTTEPPGGTADGNLLDDWVAPPGFEFERETGDIFVRIFPSPRADPVLSGAYVRYDVGALGGPNATTFPIMMILELNTDFTGDLIDSYITFEGNDAGSLVDSPGGLKMWRAPASGEISFDSTMVFIGRYAINLRSDPSVDALGLLDAFVDANFE